MVKADETPVFFDMPTNITFDAKGSQSVLVKTYKAFRSGSWEETDTICYSEEKQSSNRSTS